MYDVNHFIKKFEAIPSWRWCTKVFDKKKFFFFKAHCALGHCGVVSIEREEYVPEFRALSNLFYKHMLSVSSVNDEISPAFRHFTPKKRVLAALHWIKEKNDA